MLRSMFGMGGTEILVILIVALLFLGPDKLPEAAKTISKGIRDIKKQSRVLQRTIEDDEHIGGAIRDLRSALRGEDEPYRPPPKPPKELDSTTSATSSEIVSAEPEAPRPDGLLTDAAEGTHGTHNGVSGSDAPADTGSPPSTASTDVAGTSGTAGAPAAGPPALTFPPTAGQPDEDAPPPSATADAELASLVKPAPNTIAHTPRGVSDPAQSTGRKHG
jgi:sec-independent protein translocase protein TatB